MFFSSGAGHGEGGGVRAGGCGGQSFYSKYWERKTTHKQTVHGIISGFSAKFGLRVFSPKRNDPGTKKTHINKILAPTQFRDNPANLFMLMYFSFPEVQGEEGSEEDGVGGAQGFGRVSWGREGGGVNYF